MLKKLLILFLFISLKASSQIAPNIGFEDGTFSHWECYAGAINPTGVISVTNTGPIFDRHTIIGKASKNIIDPYGDFPILCPNGSKSWINCIIKIDYK